MKGTKNWIQPFQWASNSTAKTKLAIRAMDLVALKTYKIIVSTCQPVECQ